MKQITRNTAIISAAILGATFSMTASADTLLGGYVGANAWNIGVSGGFSQEESVTEFEFDDKSNTSFYAALEHPIPLVPNVKLAQTTMDTIGSAQLQAQFTFGGEVYLVDTALNTQADITATDITLYYEILDNDIISLDLGLTGKQLDGDFTVIDENGRQSQESFDGIIPMVYGKVAIGLPLTGLGVFAEGNALAIDNDSFTDYQVGISYSFVETLALDLSLYAGYRSTALDIEDLDGIYADLEFDGAFVGLEFDF